MNLQLPKTKAYHYMNDETIREMCHRFNVKPSSLPRYKDEPWESKFEKYMRDITGHAPCQICNGPMTYKPGLKSVFYPNGIVCLDHPSHTASIAVAWLRINHMLKRKEMMPEQVVEKFSESVAIALGPICEHKDFLADCPVCISRLKERAAEAIDIEVGIQAAQPHEDVPEEELTALIEASNEMSSVRG